MFSEPEPPALDAPAARPTATLSGVRARSVERAARLVAAARDLADERQCSAFTVHEVATRAGSSLKGFYRCFAGKDDLLVALLAADSRIGADILAQRVLAAPTHVERLRTCVTGLLDLCTVPGAEGYARVLVSEHRRLSQERPDELAAALAPIVAVITAAIDGAVRADAASSEAPGRDAETVFSLVLDGIHAVSFGRVDPAEHATYLWGFCSRALGVAGSPALSSTRSELPQEAP